jgi:hypothetical protein
MRESGQGEHFYPVLIYQRAFYFRSHLTNPKLYICSDRLDVQFQRLGGYGSCRADFFCPTLRHNWRYKRFSQPGNPMGVRQENKALKLVFGGFWLDESCLASSNKWDSFVSYTKVIHLVITACIKLSYRRAVQPLYAGTIPLSGSSVGIRWTGLTVVIGCIPSSGSRM